MSAKVIRQHSIVGPHAAGGDRTPWSPIADGPRAEQYRQLSLHLVTALKAKPSPAMKDPSDWGPALATAYWYRCFHSSEHHTDCVGYLDRTIQAVNGGRFRPGLYGGFTGVAWLLNHLCRVDCIESDLGCDEIDDAIEAACREMAGLRGYDLISGLVGLGTYSVTRLPSPVASRNIRGIVDWLDSTAIRRDGGITWLTPASLLPEHERQMSPGGYYNLGVAHGVPGVVGFLGQAWSAGVDDPRVRSLLLGATKWVLDSWNANSELRSWIAPGVADQHKVSRLSWCYGELGVAAVLLRAVRAVGDDTIEQCLLQHAKRSAARREVRQVRDAMLCHGAAGNAHVFNRLYQLTQLEDFREAALFWFDVTTEMAGPNAEEPRFRFWFGDKKAYRSCDSFLCGTSGVALALLAAATTIEPRWDETLLLS